jgi:hypothetical protein
VTVAVLGAKAVLAVMLLVAGGAKLADLAGFAASVRLFVPRSLAGPASSLSSVSRSSVSRLPVSGPPAFWPASSWSPVRWIALAVALAELALGGASLTSPAVGWLNPVILVVGCAFVAVSGAGYAFHRGRSCRCFGALSQRRFDLSGIGRAVVIAAVAGAATAAVPASSVRLGIADRGLLRAASCLIAFVAFTAARSLAATREALPEMVS